MTLRKGENGVFSIDLTDTSGNPLLVSSLIVGECTLVLIENGTIIEEFILNAVSSKFTGTGSNLKYEVTPAISLSIDKKADVLITLVKADASAPVTGKKYMIFERKVSIKS